MKKHLYQILTAIALLCLLLVLTLGHRPFSWEPSFSTKSKQPFGSYLFDELMQQTLPGGYEVKDNLPDSLDASTVAVLYCKYYVGSQNEDLAMQEVLRARRLDSLANAGAHVIVAVSEFQIPYSWSRDSIQMAYDLRCSSSSKFWVNNLYDRIQKMKTEPQKSEAVVWRKDKRQFELPYFMVGDNLLDESSKSSAHERLLVTPDAPITIYAFKRTYRSGGSIEFVSLPLLFSNYSVADPELVQLTLRLLYPVRNRHLVRIMGKNQPPKHQESKNRDSLSFLRENPPLHWALNITLVTVLLMLVFGSRRKMRSIPPKAETRNETLDFACFMGTFHYRRKDYVAVVLSQYQELLHALNEMIAGDITRMNSDDLCRLIMAKSHLPEEDVRPLVMSVSKLRKSDVIKERMMMKMLDQIKKIKDNL